MRSKTLNGCDTLPFHPTEKISCFLIMAICIRFLLKEGRQPHCSVTRHMILCPSGAITANQSFLQVTGMATSISLSLLHQAGRCEGLHRIQLMNFHMIFTIRIAWYCLVRPEWMCLRTGSFLQKHYLSCTRYRLRVDGQNSY